MECVEMELGEPDASGRRRPIVKKGSQFVLDVDTVVVALGTTPNPLISSTTQGLKTTSHGTLVAEEATGKTVKDKVWAGGDAVTGAATVISAMGAGKRAAASMDQFLKARSHGRTGKLALVSLLAQHERLEVQAGLTPDDRQHLKRYEVKTADTTRFRCSSLK